MFDHAREAVAMAKGRTRADLDADRQFNLALVRLLEIVGEAANRMPEDERARFPDVPWPQIVGLRNRLIHGYDEVDFDILGRSSPGTCRPSSNPWSRFSLLTSDF